ncbi:MAG: hypothetical protein WC271_03835 [Bacteroidales bacterium]|nr:hypothetical protein [Bacteroidales bacterium]MDD3131923.1 hypothetical protein [Bacteroidales bacterium]NCU36392.1 hypothetical protein [Candidatus Falkowbacteria bacterium]
MVSTVSARSTASSTTGQRSYPKLVSTSWFRQTQPHHHISTSAHQYISTSAHQHISTSAHQHISNHQPKVLP